MEVFERSFEDSLAIFKQLLQHKKMTRFRNEYLALHTYDQAKLFNHFEAQERALVYQYLSPDEIAEIFDDMENENFDLSKEYFLEMESMYAATVLAKMYADNAVDVLNHIEDRDKIAIFLHLMPKEAASELSQLMNYIEDSAGSIMTTEFVMVQENFTVKEAYDYIKTCAVDAETIYYAYVVDEDRILKGVISLRDLILKEDSTPIKEIENTRVISVQVSDDKLEVAKMVRDYNLLALPVVGFDHKLLGIITVDDVLDVMQEEADSDYSGLAAVDVNETHKSPLSASKSRLPWLITLLFLGMGTASLISQFEGLISIAPVLSSFVTLITGTAGNAGTQSLAVAVRKLTNRSEDDPFFESFGFEMLTGVITGIVMGLTIALVAGIWKQNLLLGVIIGVAMACAIVVANIAGALIPKVMLKFGFDPAVASGPFISTLSDLTSVFIYFTIASLFLSYL
ncbi:magnesium transporter [Facklamia hominis]|uniref:magnesium transporter n=1 Tax=Facklamia hominis TaxID=178214 RepID=UPI000C7DAFCC|nr:magnesium transporter [Facklamia hominis]PKY93047.1 magnesium transporter [Facklamia hominis]RYC97724.1 magnesium transporter [Facklamia hominis]